MQYVNGKMKDVNIAYIGGGSRGWAWTFMTDLALEDSLSGTIRLYDIDNEASKSNEIIGNHLSGRKEAVGKWNYAVKESLKDALTGTDFVVISILPGTFDEMEADVHMPERLGIYQSVGGTAGPGGTIRALRTIPMFEDVRKALQKEKRKRKDPSWEPFVVDGYFDFVFLNANGKVYTPAAIFDKIQSIVQDYNHEETARAWAEHREPALIPKISAHIFRHTFCTRMCETNANIKVIQDVMGHKNIRTTMDVYNEATTEEKHKNFKALEGAIYLG